MNKINLLIALLLTAVFTSAFADDSTRSIMEKVDARDTGKTLQQNMTMIMIDKNGNKRIRELNSQSKSFGDDERRILFFQSPANVKNTAFLTYDYDDANKDDDQWLYLPALKKVKRIPSSDKSSSFMGSDFSYFDMTDRDLEDYKFKVLKEMQVRGKAVWVIESLPKNDKIIKESGYSKTIAFVRKDNYVVVRSISFLTNGRKKYLDVKKIHQQDNIWLTDEMTMTTKKGKTVLHKTILQFTNSKLNQPINDNMFTTRRLEKGL